MAQAIIILDQTGMPSDLNYRVAYWLDVPAARQVFYADPAATSAFVGIGADDLAAIRAGQILEVVETIPRLAGTALATVKQAARDRLPALQLEFNRDNRFNRYGTRWTPGVGWVDVVVA
jgi:hypothetical protein